MLRLHTYTIAKKDSEAQRGQKDYWQTTMHQNDGSKHLGAVGQEDVAERDHGRIFPAERLFNWEYDVHLAQPRQSQTECGNNIHHVVRIPIQLLDASELLTKIQAGMLLFLMSTKLDMNR